MSEIITCPYCGASVEDTSYEFCPYCGTKNPTGLEHAQKILQA